MKNIKVYEAMAKLDLSEEEREWASARAGELTAAFAALENIDTEGVEPLVSVLDIQNILRDDTVNKFSTRDELLANAPEQYDGYFQVPKTLE